MRPGPAGRRRRRSTGPARSPAGDVKEWRENRPTAARAAPRMRGSPPRFRGAVLEAREARRDRGSASAAQGAVDGSGERTHAERESRTGRPSERARPLGSPGSRAARAPHRRRAGTRGAATVVARAGRLRPRVHQVRQVRRGLPNARTQDRRGNGSGRLRRRRVHVLRRVRRVVPGAGVRRRGTRGGRAPVDRRRPDRRDVPRSPRRRMPELRRCVRGARDPFPPAAERGGARAPRRRWTLHRLRRMRARVPGQRDRRAPAPRRPRSRLTQRRRRGPTRRARAL